MKRIAVALALAATSTFGVVAVTAAPAQALPSTCNGTLGSASYGVMCRAGTGFYRAWANCTHDNNSTLKKYFYGSAVGIGGYSKAACGANYHLKNKSSDYGVSKSDYLPPNW
ncbi:hypothetical protein [Micromonospora sp. NPDC093277]|uniref:hypothetical protein n=1 Tax=Micromonospora sp. NPDC093277 TaxID=3364291 RepID=UPI0038291FC9